MQTKPCIAPRCKHLRRRSSKYCENCLMKFVFDKRRETENGKICAVCSEPLKGWKTKICSTECRKVHDSKRTKTYK